VSAAAIARTTTIDRAASLSFTASMVALIVMLPVVWVALAIGSTLSAAVVGLVGLGTAGVWVLTIAMFRYGLRG
jgi:hypothetical protein